MRKSLIWLNNKITGWRIASVPPGNLLLLLPHCLQQSNCDRKLTHDPDKCARCGNCDLAAILRLRDEFGLQCHVAGGGREALARLRRPDVRAVVAVACAKELMEGIWAAFPKPVLAVPLTTPHGPCKDTRADLSALRAAVHRMLA